MLILESLISNTKSYIDKICFFTKISQVSLKNVYLYSVLGELNLKKKVKSDTFTSQCKLCL